MAFAFSNKSPGNSNWRNPFLKIGQGILLVDDTIHHSVNWTAEKIEKRTGLSRSDLISAVFTSGYCVSAATAYFRESPQKAMFFVTIGIPLSTGTAIVTSRSINHSKSSPDHINVPDIICKISRLPALMLAPITGLIISPAYGILFSCLSTALYLASSSNGMLDRFKTWVKDRLNPVKEQLTTVPEQTGFAPVPIKIQVKY